MTKKYEKEKDEKENRDRKDLKEGKEQNSQKGELKGSSAYPSYQQSGSQHAALSQLTSPAVLPPNMPDLDKLPKEVKEKLEKIKGKIEEFQKEILKKFDKYIIGVGLLPPPKETQDKDKIHIAILVDDTDSQKMSKLELKDKLSTICLLYTSPSPRD